MYNRGRVMIIKGGSKSGGRRCGEKFPARGFGALLRNPVMVSLPRG